jgi:hypothetical protein
LLNLFMTYSSSIMALRFKPGFTYPEA